MIFQGIQTGIAKKPYIFVFLFKRERVQSRLVNFCMFRIFLDHYIYMHAQASLVGLEPSRAAKFCSASSSPTMLLSYLCVRVAEMVKTVRR